MSDEQTTPLPNVPALGAQFTAMTSETYGKVHGYSNEYTFARAFQAGYIYAKIERVLSRVALSLHADTELRFDYDSALEVSLGKRQTFAHLAQLLDLTQRVLGGEWRSSDLPEQAKRIYYLHRIIDDEVQEYDFILRIVARVGDSEYCRVVREETGEELVKRYKTTLVCDESVTPAAPAATAGTEGEAHVEQA